MADLKDTRVSAKNQNLDEDNSAVLTEAVRSFPSEKPFPEKMTSPWISDGLTLGSDEFLDDLKKHHNEICLYGDTHMTRLIGYYEDDNDCYYLVSGLNGDKTRLMSCVGGLLSLKKYLPEQVYKGIESTFSLNGSEPTDTFKVENTQTNHSQ